MLLPACAACMVHVPASTNVALVPLTVQMLCVEEVKVTPRPELAVAESTNGTATVWLAMAGNVMLCDAKPVPVSVMLCVAPPLLLSVMLMLPVSGPVDVGENVTLIVQEPPAATPPEQVLV